MTEEEVLHYCIGETGDIAPIINALSLDFDLVSAHAALSRSRDMESGSQERRQLIVSALESIKEAKDDVLSLRSDLALIQDIAPLNASAISEHIDTIEDYLDRVPVEGSTETLQRLDGLTDLSHSLMQEVRDSTMAFIAECYLQHLT